MFVGFGAASLGLSSVPLILGSGSASRAAILREAGLAFEVAKPGIDEKAIRKETATELVLALGVAKAAALRTGERGADFASRGALLITADQVVVAQGGAILEKPESSAQAREFIASYADEPPRTVGSCVVTDAASGQQWSAVDEACVYFRPIPPDTVDALVAEGSVFQCAGGLMVEHPLVAPHIERMEGSMDTIMGLSVATLKRLVADALQARGQDPR